MTKGCKSDCDKPIKGISCAVKNCQYHDGECKCVAGSIAVGPAGACCSSDTVCATFRRKETQ
ncbi:MAG: DUF1540 domain-containing protein [Clostridia bacterium]|nr:DUF1540 domain-containing protein [Clostridia bacterium]